MSKVAIVTDSTSYMPEELLKKYNISVAPQVLIWGDQTYRDGVDIKPLEFFTKLKTAKVMPTTSQASPATLQPIFQSLIEQGNDVIAIHVSSKLSGTVQSAIQAKEMLGAAGEKVTVIDSLSTSMAMSFQVLAVARAVEAGANLKEAVEVASRARDLSGVYLVPETLEFLHRGGRIGGAQRFIGTVLNMKPVLALQNGRVEGIERVRTKGKAHDRMVELVAERIKSKANIRVATLHANAPEDAKAVLAKAIAEFNPVESISTEVSPTVGTHTGPGTVGLAFMTDL
jgi:DegV family protein with EDD domain